MSENKELFVTNVGSHMWGMNRPDSDIDIFTVYQAPSTDFLLGKAHTNSHRSMNENIDRVSFELGHVVSQLLKGNINYLWGVMSPKIIKDWDKLQTLRELTSKNLSKQLYHSVHGLGLHNYKKYVESQKDPTAKRCTLICRSLNFGTKLLTKGMFSFAPMEPCTPKDVLEYLHALDLAYVSSPLPEYPECEREMYAWLLDVRLHKLKEELPIFFSVNPAYAKKGDLMERELEIVISKVKLLDQLNMNKERFVKSYEALLKAYEKKVAEYQTKYGAYAKKVVLKQLEKKDGQEPIAPPKPEDRTKDYDFYIEMLTQDENGDITLSETLFKRLWKDRWDWTRSYFNMLNLYAGGSGSLAEMASAYSMGD